MESMHPKTSPRDFFLYLLVIGTLYICVWRYIDLLFEYINYLVPDTIERAHEAWRYRGMTDSVKWSISSLVIVFPVYLFTTWYLRKDAIAHPEKREIRVRKWLLNFTLFLAVVTILADLVTLLNRFLDGDLTARFVLKVLAVLAVSGAVLAYYLWDLRRETLPDSKPSRRLLLMASMVMLSSIVAGFFIIGSPVTQRKMKFDETRVQNLQNIQSQVVNFWQTKGRLPESLAMLKDDIRGYRASEDPETGEAYEYRVTGEHSFELCAVFALSSSQKTTQKLSVIQPYYNDAFNGNFEHASGRVCFNRTIDPDRYPAKQIKPKPVNLE